MVNPTETSTDTGSGFLRRYDPPEKVRAMHDRHKPWGHELYIPRLWQVVRVKPLGLGEPYRVVETDDEQSAIQCAVDENEQLQAELAKRPERIDSVFRTQVAIELQLEALCWISAYRIAEDGAVTATDQLAQRRRLTATPAGVIERSCPAGCGNLQGTAAQWDAHRLEHERVKGMGRAGLIEALEMARRAGDTAGVMLYAATWRSEIGGEPPGNP